VNYLGDGWELRTQNRPCPAPIAADLEKIQMSADGEGAGVVAVADTT